ncbi:MAG: FkbM family methyltransferase [Sulfuricellaceae bacterium]|nr:FkbM family methyltransferase [Sulfuricellaceae bacterium]
MKTLKRIALSLATSVIRHLYSDERAQFVGNVARPSELARIVARLPLAERISFIHEILPLDQYVPALDRQTRYQLLAKCSESLSVESIRVSSRLGSYEGSPLDKIITASYCINGTWAPKLQAILAKLFPDGNGSFLDIGANIGLTCIPIARARRVNCYVFEPGPENYRMLLRNIDANDVSAFVHAKQLALYSEAGVMNFELSSVNFGDHRLRDKNATVSVGDLFAEGGRNVIEVKTIRLDDAISVDSLTHPVIMKIDTQGAEVHVLDGAAKTLEQTDVIICEVSPYHLARMGHTVEMLLDRLTAFKYAAIVQFDELLHDHNNDQYNSIEPIAGEMGVVRQRILELSVNTSPDNYFDVVFSRRPFAELISPKPPG